MNSSSATLVLAAHLAMLSSISFGGFPTVLPDVHDFAVANGWVTDEEFANFFAVSQVMPGPNIVGITVCVGAKLRGALGAISAVAGFILVPWIVGLTIGGIVLRSAEIAVLQNVLSGLSASAAGLLIGTGLRLLMPHRSRRTALLFAGLAFAGMAFTRLPLLMVLLALAPVSIAVAGLESARAQ